MADIITQTQTIPVELTKLELEVLIKMITDLKVAGTIDDLPKGITELRVLRGKLIEALQVSLKGPEDGHPDADTGDQ